MSRAPGGPLAVWATTSIVAAGGLLALQPALGLSPEILALVMLAPAVGAAVAWAVFGDRAFAPFPRLSGHTRFGTTLFHVVLIVAVQFVTVSVVLGRAPHLPGRVAGLPVVVMLIAQVIGALSEEIGFRGVLLPALASRMPRLAAAILTGLIFGVWHVQYFGLPPLEHIAFLGGAVAMTVTTALVMAGPFWQRMTACTAIHAGVNLALASTAGPEPALFAAAAASAVGLLTAAALDPQACRALLRGRGDATG